VVGYVFQFYKELRKVGHTFETCYKLYTSFTDT